jgi:hypothetical protein
MTGAVAIARATLRTLIRSRLAPAMLLAVLAAGGALPLALRGDGTLEGLIRIHLTYTLGLASFLLGLFTLWTGCASISREAETRTLHLIVTKPVPRLSIWLGKWLALLVLDAALLAAAVLASAATLHYRVHSPAFSDAQRAEALPRSLAALSILCAPLPDVESAVRSDYLRLKDAGRLPDLPESTLLAQIRRNVLAREFALAPGTSRTWRFTPPSGIPGDAPAWLQLRCDTSLLGSAGTTVAWLPGGEGQSERDFAFIPGIPRLLPSPLPLSAYGDPAVPGTLALTLVNRDPADATLVFDPDDGVLLRVRTGTFAGNLLRAALLLYARMALLAAVGLTLGTLFSLPVAAFASVVLLLLIQLSNFIGAAAQTDRATFVANVAPFGADAHPHDEAPSDEPAVAPSPAARAAATALYYLYRATWYLLRPLLEDTTIDRLSTATAIPASEVFATLLRQLLLLPLLLSLLSTASLRSREWALPAES